MKTRALLCVLGASVVLLTAAGAAQADGNQIIPGSDLIQTETYGFDGNGDYQPEDRNDFRDLDSDSPAEIKGLGKPSPVAVWVNTTADPKGCLDDSDPSDCTGGAITVAGEVRNVSRVAARLGSNDIQGGTGSAEAYAEDRTKGDVLADVINDAAYAANENYTTSGEDDDGHSCGNEQGNCDDETNVLVSLP